MKGIEFAVKNAISWGLLALVFVAFTAMSVRYLLFYRKGGSSKPVRFNYSEIDSNDRKAVIAVFRTAEKHLAKNGFRRRLDNESYREYSFAAQLFSGEDAEGLNWMADAASKTAFSSAAIDSAQVDSATGHAKTYKLKLASSN
ncbi:MAG: hypothetical protein O2921_05175 [Chloroflexi bacterium]|jgi:hypothetical protein|nr:hypothetical protein [Chloroflexota bacterium]